MASPRRITSTPSFVTERAVLLAGGAFLFAVAALSWPDGDGGIWVYALSFWNYLIYVAAFAFRAVSVERFRLDAMVTRSVALTVLALVYLPGLSSLLSLVVVACGFALNASAVMALGSKRTYYGFELDALPPVHVTRFPYSVTAHPMLLGNLIGFGGTLLDPAFRQDWWPLAVLHLVGNGTVLVMEARGKPPSVHWPLGGLLATALLIALHSPAGGPAAVGWFVLCTAFGLVVIATYARRPREGRSPTVPHHA